MTISCLVMVKHGCVKTLPAVGLLTGHVHELLKRLCGMTTVLTVAYPFWVTFILTGTAVRGVFTLMVSVDSIVIIAAITPSWSME